MFRRYLIASYYVSLAVCAPQYFPSLVSYTERPTAESEPWSSKVASSTSVSESSFDTLGWPSSTSLNEAISAAATATATSEVTVTSTIESAIASTSTTSTEALIATEIPTTTSSSTASLITGCRKLPSGGLPKGFKLEDLSRGRDSDCLKQYFSTRSSSAPGISSISISSGATATKSSPMATRSTGSTIATQSSASKTSSATRSTATQSATVETAAHASGVWHPRISDKSMGPTFQIILNGVPDLKPDAKHMVPDVDIFDIDLFRTEKKTIDIMKRLNKTVVCYFSGGTYEPNRPDSNQFSLLDQGLRLVQWPSEKWVRTPSSNIRKIMTARIQLAHQKGCDAIDPDNVDAYGSGAGGGLGLTKRDSINYVEFLSKTAAKYNLAVGLKNSLEILPDVKHLVHFAVNEECVKANECVKYKDFLTKDKKPVFHIEYPVADRPKSLGASDREKWCGGRAPTEVKGSLNFQTVIKTMQLNGWVQYCNGTQASTPINDTPGSRWSLRGDGSGGSKNNVLADQRLHMTVDEMEIAKQDQYPFDLEKVELVQVDEMTTTPFVESPQGTDNSMAKDKR